jgi:hypothetical protein
MPHGAILQALCALGFGAGLLMFLAGLRPIRKRSTSVALDLTPVPKYRDSGVQPHARSGSPVHVIQLTPEVGALKSADMSQQQKIAAALSRAGISNAAWADADPPADDNATAQVTTTSKNTEPAANAPYDPARKTAPARTAWRKFLLWAGPAIAFLSLYLLVRLKSL